MSSVDETAATTEAEAEAASPDVAASPQEEALQDSKIAMEDSGTAEGHNTDDDSSSNQEAAEGEEDSFDDARFLSTVVEEEEDEDSPDSAFLVQDEKQQAQVADDNSIPLFQYSRLTGSLPRATAAASPNDQAQQTASPPFSTQRSCAILGKVILSSETTLSSTEGEAATSAGTSSPTRSSSTQTPTTSNNPTVLPAELWQQQPIPIAAYGFSDGRIWLVDAITGIAVAGPDQLVVRDSNRSKIIGLGLDASGTFLAALDEGGMCAIFELKYAVQLQSSTRRPATTTQQRRQQRQGNVFSSFVSAWTGGGGQSSRNVNEGNNATSESTTTETAEAEPDELVPTLTLASLQVQHISYPRSFGKPTCLALDPAYKRKRDKAFIAGFADGKLVLTKRGFVFQRRNDAVLYQAVKQDPFRGIEAIAWRGSLVAWADSSGVRLLDSDSLQRIAHVDRPSGARPSLYPTVSHVQPSLCFETSTRLLVAWGDCLLSLHVQERTVTTSSMGAEAQHSAGSSSGAVVRRRHVDCTMAWELDCISCDVVPLDAKHVVVLGLVPPANETDKGPIRNDVELQVVSRVDGTVVFADMLPLVRVAAEPKRRGRASPLESTEEYQLLSSFAVPRLDDASESQDLSSRWSYFGVTENNGVFCDSHLAWGLDKILFEDEDLGINSATKEHSAHDSDDESIDSDDYNYALSPFPETKERGQQRQLPPPPVMIVTSGSDAVLTRTRDLDDALSAALECKRPALALRRGLEHMRQLRRYRIEDLVNEYFRALLCLRESDVKEKRTLSMRRMKLAARAMPILLGGNMEAWEYWIAELKKLPGALFAVRNSLPVRGMWIIL